MALSKNAISFRPDSPLDKEVCFGRILFISSESAVQIPAEIVHYAMTKAAQVEVACGIAESVAGTGVSADRISLTQRNRKVWQGS